MTETHSSIPLLQEVRKFSPDLVLDIADQVWARREAFVRWPTRPLLFWPESIRLTRKGEHYIYPAAQKALASASNVAIDRRSNGPAIVAFLIAGGERPLKVGVNHGWSVHHIYDGLHPAPGRTKTVHAVKMGDLFTEAAGLVALHPIADALASEVPFFAWCLRYEAYLRFGLDPDGVFGPTAQPDFQLSGDLDTLFHSTASKGEGPAMSKNSQVSYRSTRLHFKADLIEPLKDDDVFEVQTPDATWRMTKAQFYETFLHVVSTESYAGSRREYFYRKPPRKADQFLV